MGLLLCVCCLLLLGSKEGDEEIKEGSKCEDADAFA